MCRQVALLACMPFTPTAKEASRSPPESLGNASTWGPGGGRRGCLQAQVAMLKSKRMKRAGKVGTAEAPRASVMDSTPLPPVGNASSPAEEHLGPLARRQ